MEVVGDGEIVKLKYNGQERVIWDLSSSVILSFVQGLVC